jgi:hypothetical protein
MILGTILSLAAGAALVGCGAANDPAGGRGARGGAEIPGPKLAALDLDNPLDPVAGEGPIALAGARNEWIGFAVEISELPAPMRDFTYRLRVRAPRSSDGKSSVELSNFSADQILPMPVDTNRAGFVRHTGLTLLSPGARPASAAVGAPRVPRAPRALLPLPMENGAVDLSSARDPADPTNPYAHPDAYAPQARAGGDPRGAADPADGDRPALRFWIDLHIPAGAAAGAYAGRCDLLRSDSNTPIASLPLRLTVYGFAIPAERHLIMSSGLRWEDLKRLYPERFETVTAKFMNRNDDRYTDSIRTLDQIIRLAQQHRTEVIVDRLQPTVKWPPLKAGASETERGGRAERGAPRVDWSDLDTVLAPWLSGDAFADRVPLGYWPLPGVNFLENYDRASQLQYWSNAAAHFDRKNWLARAPVRLELPRAGAGSDADGSESAGAGGRAGAADSLQLSAEAAQVLAAHPRLCVALPLEDDQLRFASAGNRHLLQPATMDRVWSAASGIVFASPRRAWPENVKVPRHWLGTGGVVPYIGAGGDERDVRVWAWLAFVRAARLITWGPTLPQSDTAAQPANPDDLVWFYPGSWFGLNEPVPTIQLKWLRRAEQDFEYLQLARERGQSANAMKLARLLAKPVQIEPNQTPDPTYALMCAAADPSAWAQAQRLLARMIELNAPGHAPDPAAQKALDLETIQWCQPQERPVLMGRTVRWEIDNLASETGGAMSAGSGEGATGAAGAGDWTAVPRWIRLSLGVDIYNPADAAPARHLLEWSSVPHGWEFTPNATIIPTLAPNHVERFPMHARYNLAAIDAEQNRPAQITFTNGYNNHKTSARLMLPVAPSDRHKPGLRIDGKLNDWDAADAIQRGPLIRMFNRPALQKQTLEYADDPANIYTGWSDEKFYVAFDLGGVDAGPVRSMRNFVEYEFGRAWGEDLCEILIQPIYADNSVGPILHVVCKPTGQWIERKLDPRLYVDPWQPFEGSGIRYAGTRDGQIWRGEVEIPWRAITDRAEGRPVLLRFNFSQHVHGSAQSASWAGPIDSGRDEHFMGLLFLREPNIPGMSRSAR